MQITKVLISDLVFDPTNARTHSEKNINAIKGSLTKFGQQKPIVISQDNIIVAGNGTVAAAKDLGWTELDAVVTSLDSFHQTAFALADNRTSELAEWEDNILAQQLASLEMHDFDLESIGFDAKDLEDMTVKDQDLSDKNKELSEDDFQKFDQTCPRCGFEFDNKKS